MSQNNVITGVKVVKNKTRVIKKEKKIIVTGKQRATAIALVENVRTNKPLGQVLKSVGYKKSISEHPSRVIESQGVKQALREIGANEFKIAEVFHSGLEANRVDIIKGKSEPSDLPDVALRVKTAETVAKLLGYSTDTKPSGNNYTTFVQVNQLDPNKPAVSSVVDNTLDLLMAQTKED